MMTERDPDKVSKPNGSACPRCGEANAPGVAFCASCGGPIIDAPVLCPACHAYQNPTNRLCEKCGADLRGSSPTGDHFA